MNQYFPITKQELSLIKNNCYHPETDSCDGCEYASYKDKGCTWKGANILEEEILTRNPYQSERDIPECKITEGALLKLCECGNDTFRCVETADWIVEIEQWEGDDLLKICTKCGKDIGCFSDAKHGKSISRKTLAELRQKASEQCGDNCKGECSGEVTGTPFCPQSERDTVLDEPERLKDCKNCHLPCSQTGKEISFYGKCPEFRFGNQTPSEGDLVVRESVKMFAVLMEAKLRKNDYKSHWSKESFTYLFGRLDEEMKELNQAVSSAKTDYKRIADEAIDVANFLMMIVDNMEELRQAGEP